MTLLQILKKSEGFNLNFVHGDCVLMCRLTWIDSQPFARTYDGKLIAITPRTVRNFKYATIHKRSARNDFSRRMPMIGRR